MSQLNQEPHTPWYKEPWMILVLGLPVMSVIGGMTMLTVAINGKDTLVRDNYYKDGLAINQELAWDQKAINLDLSGNITVTASQLELSLNTPKSANPQVLKLSLSHPTLEQKDQEFLLQEFKPGQYLSPVEVLPEGRYYLDLSSPVQGWRIRSQVIFTSGQAVSFASNTP